LKKVKCNKTGTNKIKGQSLISGRPIDFFEPIFDQTTKKTRICSYINIKFVDSTLPNNIPIKLRLSFHFNDNKNINKEICYFDSESFLLQCRNPNRKDNKLDKTKNKKRKYDQIIDHDNIFDEYVEIETNNVFDNDGEHNEKSDPSNEYKNNDNKVDNIESVQYKFQMFTDKPNDPIVNNVHHNGNQLFNHNYYRPIIYNHNPVYPPYQHYPYYQPYWYNNQSYIHPNTIPYVDKNKQTYRYYNK
jgi:hypothetical protein